MRRLRAPLVLVFVLSTAACSVELDLGSRGAHGGTGAGGGAGLAATSSAQASSGSSGVVGVSSSSGSGGTPCDGGVCGGVLASAIATSAYHTCVIVDSGVKCWGYDAWGLLGDDAKPGSFANIYLPVDVKGLSNVVALAAGVDHTCALTSAGGVACWGNNLYGYLGDGSLTEAHVPVDVVGLTSGATAVSAAETWTCAVAAGGAVQGWGYNGSAKLLVDDDSGLSKVPVDRAGLSTSAVAVAAGRHHGCALLSTGGITCWGNNANGQLGDGSWTPSPVPVAVTGLSSGVVAVSAGDSHTCALTAAGAVKCWGKNAKGQLGNNTTVDSPVPVDVVGLSAGAASISAGKAQTCVVTSGGGVRCWGENGSGKLGNNTFGDSFVPVDVVGLASSAVAVSTSVQHTCALLSSGKVMCWGDNYHYQLGTNATANSSVPVDVMGL